MNYGNGGSPESSGEVATIRYIRKITKNERPVVFDVGANIGQYCQKLLHALPPNWSIYSFEPSKATFAILRDRIREPRVQLQNMGLGEQNGTLTLYHYHDRSSLASVFKRDLTHYQIDQTEKEEITIETIDRFCEAHQITFIDFLKLDIEGNELATLKGARQMLENKNIGAIQFEFGGTNIDSRTNFRDFWNLLHENYNLYRILKDGLAHIPSYNEMREIYMNINYLAIKKGSPTA